ncbi:HEPN domain-containing protein [bacterium]|nr:HEPN domain-containing protein [bacterium]
MFASLNPGLPQDKSIPGSPLDWLARAKGNLALAKQPKPKEAFWEDLCFQAQQAAEKAIKAVYQYKGLNFRYILLSLEGRGRVRVKPRRVGQRT